jgi:hypothetical protein
MFFKNSKRFFLSIAALTFAIVGIGSMDALAQRGQASLTLTNSDAKICYVQNNGWTVEKTTERGPITDAGTVSWTISATKTPGAVSFSVHGGLTITNTGSAPATIGNIIVNLQTPYNQKVNKTNVNWLSVSTDIANATVGDAATVGNLVAAACSEFDAPSLNNNYDIVGARGTFTENSKSGSMEFTDADNNTIWALSPQKTIAAGESVTLLYHANFDPSVAAGMVGKSFRVEALVSFGNAGGRGGSGSSATNIDINGNGLIDPDEANVRTVPSRVTTAPLAPLQQANGSVTITDPGVTTTGTVSASSPVGFDQFPATISDSTVFNPVSVNVVSGDDGGMVCNEVELNGEAVGGTLNVIVGYTPNPDPTLPPLPVYATYTCADAASASDESCVLVLANDEPPPPPPAFCTYSQGGYQGNGVPGNLLINNWGAVNPLTIGLNDGAGPNHHARWTNVNNFRTWIGGGGPSGALTADSENATSTSGGTLAKQTAALYLNTKFNPGFGSLYLVGTGTSLDGQTVQQILDASNTALGGGALPAGYTYGSLNALVANLNINTYHECVVGSFASHLSATPPAP